MDTSQKMFLLAVEEMNFTRAARRAHVTQQCLSEHIKSLEIELGTKLFTRSPRLAITDSGIVLQKTLQRISNLEKNLHVKIQEIEKGQIGEIHLGINATRAHILLPRLLPAFHSLYPKVNLIATLQDTEELVARMLNQELDVIFGIDYPAPPLLSAVPAEEEILILTATNQFLHRYYQGPEPWHDLQPGDYLDFRQFSAFPIVGNRKKSTVQHLYTTFLREQGLSHQQIVSIGKCEAPDPPAHKEYGLPDQDPHHHPQEAFHPALHAGFRPAFHAGSQGLPERNKWYIRYMKKMG